MRKSASIFVLALLLFVDRGQAEALFKIIHVDDLAALLAAKSSTVWVYDANPPAVRASEGIVPGARLLSSSGDFDVDDELPPAKDAKIVFYCANAH
jgi:hypothetical protein